MTAKRVVAPVVLAAVYLLGGWGVIASTGPWSVLGLVLMSFGYGIWSGRASLIYGRGFGVSAAWLLSLMIALLGIFALIYTETGITAGDGGPQVRTLRECAYFSVVTWTTLGYGDFAPSSAAQPFAAIEALVGYVYMAVAVGVVVHTLMSGKSAGRTLKRAA